MNLERRSIAFQRAGRSALAPPNFYGHMFQEDVRLDVVPISGRSRAHPDYEIRCDPGGREDQVRLAQFLGEGERARDSLTETVGRFIESRTAYLVEYGEVYHEIAHRDDGAPVVVALSVGGTYDFGIGAVQIVPRDAFAYNEDGDRDHRQWSVLRRAAYWHLGLPESLGGPRGHRRLIATLARLQPVTPDWAWPTVDDPNPSGFRGDVFHRIVSERVAVATRAWAWPGRNSFSLANDYAALDRRIRFAIAVTRLREHIVVELNAVSHRVGMPSVSVVGLPTEAELRELSDGVAKGEVPFAAARAQFEW